jgi:predicted metal-dependent HD superfamily phosphohydrolase
MTDAIVQKYWSLLASRHDAGAFAALDAAYCEPQRAYHAWGHIADMLQKLDSLPHLAARPDLVAAAIFWHDSVYLTLEADGRPRTDPENVRDSAALFESHSKFDDMERDAVHDLIMATAHHMKARARKEHYPGFAQDLDLFLDLDLSSLAAPWPVFLKNLDDIRFEFAWAPEQEFFLGRTMMLESFLGGGEALFRLPQTRALWLEAARANLLRADAELREKMAQAPESSISSAC